MYSSATETVQIMSEEFETSDSRWERNITNSRLAREHVKFDKEILKCIETGKETF